MKKLFCFLIILLIGVGVAWADGGNFSIIDDNASYQLQDHAGAHFTPSYSAGNPDLANIEFFPGSPSVIDPQLKPGRYTPALTQTGTTYKFELAGTSGGVWVRSWEGTPRTRYSYYGKSNSGYNTDTSASNSLACSAGSSTATHYNIKTFKTDYLADQPINAPTWGTVTESSVRDGESTNSTISLTVNFSYSEGTPKIEAQGYVLRFWKEGETDPGDSAAVDGIRVINLTSGSYSLPSTDPLTSAKFTSGTYHFKVRAYNWFGYGPWSIVKDWPTLGGGTPGYATFNYKLYGIDPAKLVINSISIPSKTTTAGSVGSATGLAAAINLSAGEKIVAAISKWDPATGASKTAAFDLTSGDVLTGTEDFTFEPGEGVQVYTTKTLENFSLIGQ